MYPPYTSASRISRLFFWWIGPLIRTGYKRDLEDNDVFDIDKNVTPDKLVDRFWEAKQTRPTWKALWVTFRREMVLSGILFLISAGLRFVGPFLLSILVTFVAQSGSGGNTDISVGTAFGVACSMFLCQVIGSLLSVHADFIAMRVGLNARNALIAATFRHLAMLSNTSRAKTNNGLIMSLVSNDAIVALEFTRFWNQTWTSPFVLAAGIIYIHVLVGVSVWAGMSILVVFVPFSYMMGRAQTRYQRQKMLSTDQRVKLTSEALQGIRIVKFNAWEAALERVLTEVRRDELLKLRYLEYVKALTTPVSVAVPNVASVLTFITYVATGNALNPASTFAVISLFVLIRSPFVTFPIAITQFSRAIVMNNRFEEFFKLERSPERILDISGKTLDDQNGTTSMAGLNVSIAENKTAPASFNSSLSMELNGKGNDVAAVVDNAEFSWDNESAFRLKVPRKVEIKKGQLIAIVGSVGAGKTSTLMAMLGEMNKLSGHVDRFGKIAYCAQEPFILNATLRENVLFGNEMQVERYARAIRLACLDADIDRLPGNDECEIGERGVNLSGGQKARVAFARALYSDADLFFLDDILSAVDAHVGKMIFEQCILKMKTKTRILVTNNLHVLSRVDKVVVLVNGTVEEYDSMDVLLKNDKGALTDIMREMKRDDDDGEQQGDGNTAQPIPSSDTTKPMLMAQHSEPELYGANGEPHKGDEEVDDDGPKNRDNDDDDEEDPFAEDNVNETEFRIQQRLLDPQKSMHHLAGGAKLTSTENRVRGKVSNQVLKTYWLSGALNSYFIVILLLLCFVVAEGVFLGVDAYLAKASQTASSNTTTFLIVYSSLSACALFGIFLRSFSFAVFHVNAVTVIYQSAAEKILRFPMTFYWKEPIGRLLNRVSGDTNMMDTQLGSSWLWLLLTIVRVLGILCLICLAIPVFAATLVPLFIVYFLFREVYRRSARDLQRIESVSKSPIMNILSETLHGTSTIRAFGRVNGWIKATDERLVTNTRARFSVESVAVWLTLYLEFLGGLVILLTALIIVALRSSIGSGFAGLALAYR